MFLLDTMIPSELRKNTRANRGVLKWSLTTTFNLQFLSVLSIYEMRRGALQQDRLDPPQGWALHNWLDDIVARYQGLILPVDEQVAEQCARLQVPAAMNHLDVFSAATALVHDMTVVTRNVRHFERTGVRVLNPFT